MSSNANGGIGITKTKIREGPHIYSYTGFDIMGILARVYYRENAKVSLGPVDMSCSFCISDRTKEDTPIVYISQAFEKLTGYRADECVGHNCRFLQSVSTEADGLATKGSRRRYTDNNVVYQIRKNLDDLEECQYSLINYKKGGEPFINFITIIPVSSYEGGPLDLFIGFQVSLIDQPYNIMRCMREGIYTINYQVDQKVKVKIEYDIDREHIGELKNLDEFDETDILKPFIVDMMGNSEGLDPQSIFYESLLDSIPYLLCLSIKGQFIHVNQACLEFLEYEPSEIINKNLSEFCHSGDWVGIMREFKNLPHIADQPIHMIFRFKRRNSGYTWLGVQGRCTFI
eukprot:NODE_244_length_11882_cov_0.560214.p4 type:complete len:343 gc:universal NODE_244_length_11882_cov_0.560214:6764-5736(-)